MFPQMQPSSDAIAATSSSSSSSNASPFLAFRPSGRRSAAQSASASQPAPSPSALPAAPAPAGPRLYCPRISTLFPVQPRFVECWEARRKLVELAEHDGAAAGRRNAAASALAAAAAAPSAPSLDRLPTLKDVFQTHNDSLSLPYVPTDLLKIIAGYAQRHAQFERRVVSAVIVWKQQPMLPRDAIDLPQQQQPIAPPVAIARFDSEAAFRAHVVRTVLEPACVGKFLSGLELAGEEAGRQYDADRSASAAVTRAAPSGCSSSSASSSSSSSSSASACSSPPSVASASWSLDDDRARYMSLARASFTAQFRRDHPGFVRLTRGCAAHPAAMEWIKLERPNTPLRMVVRQYQSAAPLMEQPSSVPRVQVDAMHRNITVEVVYVE